MSLTLSHEIETFVARPLTGVLAWTAASGEPRSAPLNYVWEDGAIWFTTGADSVKVRALRRQPIVSFSIPSEASSPPLQAVTVRGRAEILEWDPERQVRGFTRYGVPREEAESMRDHYASQTALVSIRLEPAQISTFGFESASGER